MLLWGSLDSICFFGYEKKKIIGFDMSKELSVYVHFLYCKSRCPYCDFFRGIMPKNFDEEEYVAGIIKGIDYAKTLSGKRDIKSVFFGGGTPSLLSDRSVGKILSYIDKCYGIKKDAEITIEANPNTFEIEKFLKFEASGVNRLSLGVQALNEKNLKVLGRTHSLDDAKRAMDLGVEVFDKFSVDLIYSLYGQKFDEWEKEVLEVIKRGVKHISLYQLTLEEGTVFHKKKIKEMPEDESVEFYKNTVELLRNNGFERYEVSNFSVDEYNQSVHNMVYWEGDDYLGLGKGASGRLKNGNEILALQDGKIDEVLTSEERALELVIMGFRIKKGICFDEFFKHCGIEFFDFVDEKKVCDLIKDGFMDRSEERIWLTDEGFLVMNKIIYDLV